MKTNLCSLASARYQASSPSQAPALHHPFWHIVITWILPLLFLTLTACKRQDFNYKTTNGTIIVDAYTGPGGAVVIPSVVNGRPVNSIGRDAFRGAKLTSVTIPESITTIGDGAFAGCSSLTNITIPSSVTNIGAYVFSFCTSLTNVIIPKNFTTIENGTFYGCSSLKSLVIPATLTSIGHNAFRGCTNLSSLTIPDTVTNIGNYAFAECASLKALSLKRGKAPRLGTGVFSDAPEPILWY